MMGHLRTNDRLTIRHCILSLLVWSGAIRPVLAQPSNQSSLIEELRVGRNASAAQGVMLMPSGFTVTVSGSLIVGQRSSLLVLDSAGRFIRKVGRAGDGPGEFRQISRVGTLRDTVWVFDAGSQRVTLLSEEGNFRGSRPVNVSSGRLPQRLMQPLPDGFELRERGLPGFDTARAYTALHDPTGLEVALLSAHPYSANTVNTVIGGRRIRLPQPFSDAALVASSPDGRSLVVIDRSVLRVEARSGFQVLRYDHLGQQRSRSEQSVVPTRLTTQAADSILRMLAQSYGRTPAGRGLPIEEFVRVARRDLFIPAVYPPVQSAMSGNDNSLWLRTLPDPEYWIILAETGALVHRVRIPLRSSVLFVTRDRVWIAERSASGDVELVRYRLTKQAKASP
jgi:hypothetical protein